MRLLSSSGSDIYNQPLPMGTTLAIDQSTKSYQTFWTVPAAGTYTLQVTSADPAASEALHWYYLTVWKAKDGAPVLKAVDMLRSVDFLYRYLRAEPTATANTLTISHTGGSDKSSLFSMDSGSQFALNALETANVFEDTNTYRVSTGYYLAKYSITLGTSADLGYESKAYPCPYHSDYSDLRGIFKPCSAATPSNTFTIPAAAGSIFGDSLLQLEDQSDARPTHDLGALSQGQQVEVIVNFPRPTGKTPTSFRLTLLDQSNNPVIPQTYPFGVRLSIDTVSPYKFYSTWMVPSSGSYKIRVEEADSAFPTSFVLYEFLAKVTGGPTILQESDILRGNNLFHLIYHSSQGDLTLGSTLGATHIDLYRMESSNNLLLVLSPQSATSPDPITKIFQNLPAGFYGVSFGYDPSGSAGSAYYFSDSYGCPNTQTFTDVRGIFKPCSGSTTDFSSKVNLHQREALKGHKCIGRTFYFEGSCFPVNPTCNTFDPLSGRCKTCAVPSHKIRSDGLCGPSVTIPACPSGASLIGANCVSDKCATSKIDGTCATCKSAAETVQSDGSCGLKSCAFGEILDLVTGNCVS